MVCMGVFNVPYFLLPLRWNLLLFYLLLISIILINSVHGIARMGTIESNVSITWPLHHHALKVVDLVTLRRYGEHFYLSIQIDVMNVSSIHHSWQASGKKPSIEFRLLASYTDSTTKVRGNYNFSMHNEIIGSEYTGAMCTVALDTKADVHTHECWKNLEMQLSDYRFFKRQENVSLKFFLQRHNSNLLPSELQRLNVVVRAELVSFPFEFQRWVSKKLTKDMVDCTFNTLAQTNPVFLRSTGILNISDGGKHVQIYNFTNEVVDSASSSYPHRMRAMQQGIQQAVAFALEKKFVSSFPNLKAIVMIGDSSSSGILNSLQSQCRSIPILSQNIDYSPNNNFVMVPDYSYFSQFSPPHDHGKSSDIWFNVIEKELQGYRNQKMPLYERKAFQSKNVRAVYRGSIIARKTANLRQAMSNCHLDGRIDNGNSFVSHEGMCLENQAIITIPGNGVWSGASKFNLLCNSVSILVSPEEIGGETWDTRLQLGLKPWVHYLPLTNNATTVCSQLEGLMHWIANHQQEAEAMAYRSRNVVLERLHKNAILEDLANILLDYASLFSTS